MSEVALVLVVASAIVLSIGRFLADRVCLNCRVDGKKWVSFIAGSLIVLIFLELLIEAYSGIFVSGSLLALFIPFGFILFLFLERHIYGHMIRKKKSVEMRDVHLFITAVTGFLIGIILYNFVQVVAIAELLFLVVIVFYDSVDDIALHAIHDLKLRRTWKTISSRALLSVAPLYGLVFAAFVTIPAGINVALLSFISGAIFYVVIREVIPKDREVSPSYFLYGAALFSLVFALSALL